MLKNGIHQKVFQITLLITALAAHNSNLAHAWEETKIIVKAPFVATTVYPGLTDILADYDWVAYVSVPTLWATISVLITKEELRRLHEEEGLQLVLAGEEPSPELQELFGKIRMQLAQQSEIEPAAIDALDDRSLAITLLAVSL